MRLLLSGASGFLGKAINEVLSEKYQIITLGRTHSDIIVDLGKQIPLLPEVNLVVHAAGKAHSVPRTEEEKQEFFDVNVSGTARLLKGLENSVYPQALVFISTVAVYGSENGILICEKSRLSPDDSYGISKMKAELLILNWCKKNSVICTILRLPLIAGPNPPGNLRSMINGIRKGYYVNIAGGQARKSIVLAEDVAKIIPKVAQVGGIYNLTDGYHPSFSELAELIAKQIGKRQPANIPHWLASIMAEVGDLIGSKAPINSDKLRKITSDLTFDDSKARKLLGWDPTPVLEGFKIH